VQERPDEHPSLLDQILIDEGSRSWVLIPLREEGAPVGMLALTSRIPRAFCREDASIYAAVGKAIEQSLLDLARRSGRLRR
jgi:putative methionine-R-sulfoxide reductase with GAF domain